MPRQLASLHAKALGSISSDEPSGPSGWKRDAFAEGKNFAGAKRRHQIHQIEAAFETAERMIA